MCYKVFNVEDHHPLIQIIHKNNVNSSKNCLIFHSFELRAINSVFTNEKSPLPVQNRHISCSHISYHLLF